MTYRDLLVLADATPQFRHRLVAAAHLARRFGARVTALYAAPTLSLSPFAADSFPQDVVDQIEAEAADAQEAARAVFAEVTRGGGFTAEWLAEHGDGVAIATQYARHADLTVLGQTAADTRRNVAAVPPEPVVLGAGRPTLVVPDGIEPATLGERVLVAWNGTAQSARAVADSLPLLAAARSVVVLTVDDPGAAVASLPGCDIVQHLARHGVAAERRRAVAAGITAGDLLLARAADEAADLVVMGAWGHSRLRELVLGGVSRHVFRHMTVPVLMSH